MRALPFCLVPVHRRFYFTLLPRFIRNLNLVVRYRRIRVKSCRELWVQVNYAMEGENSDAEFWRQAGEGFKRLLKENRWKSELNIHKTNANSQPEFSSDHRRQIVDGQEESNHHTMRELGGMRINPHTNSPRPLDDIDYPLFRPHLIVDLYTHFRTMKTHDPVMDQLVMQDCLSFVQCYSLHDISKLAHALTNFTSTRTTETFGNWFEVVGHSLTNASRLDLYHLESVDLTTLVQLVTAFSISGSAEQKMFQKFSSALINQLTHLKVIDGSILIGIVHSYATLGFRHKRLLETIGKKLVMTTLSDNQLLALQLGYQTLQFECPQLEKIIETRNPEELRRCSYTEL